MIRTSFDSCSIAGDARAAPRRLSVRAGARHTQPRSADERTAASAAPAPGAAVGGGWEGCWGRDREGEGRGGGGGGGDYLRWDETRSACRPPRHPSPPTATCCHPYPGCSRLHRVCPSTSQRGLPRPPPPTPTSSPCRPWPTPRTAPTLARAAWRASLAIHGRWTGPQMPVRCGCLLYPQ